MIETAARIFFVSLSISYVDPCRADIRVDEKSASGERM
jgi:hypothetical protein